MQHLRSFPTKHPSHAFMSPGRELFRFRLFRSMSEFFTIPVKGLFFWGYPAMTHTGCAKTVKVLENFTKIAFRTSYYFTMNYSEYCTHFKRCVGNLDTFHEKRRSNIVHIIDVFQGELFLLPLFTGKVKKNTRRRRMLAHMLLLVKR